MPLTDTSPAVKDWFSRRRLGMFIHFGLYAIEGWHEQDQMRRRIPSDEYVKLIDRFNPTEFDADRILDIMESAGMEYVCITTKHHDGFCLWDTKETTFNVMNSPYGKDLIKQLADACHRRNVPLGLYYSVADWHHPNYPNLGRHHELPEPKPGDTPDWDKFMAYVKAQIRELCTNYGEIRHFFWDINVPEHVDPSVNEMLRELQPNIVINDRGFDEGDFGTPERDYSKGETDRVSCFSRPTEACNSVGSQSWGYREDEDYYSTAYLIRNIDGMMSKGANYLLNVGPDSKGNVNQISCDILAETGNWYKKVQEAFSDTVPCSVLTKNQEVFLTRKDNTVYVHLNQPPSADAVKLVPLEALPDQAILLNTGEQLECSNDVLPVHWQKAQRFLRIKGIPRNLLSGSETLIIKLEFDHDPSMVHADDQEFKG